MGWPVRSGCRACRRVAGLRPRSCLGQPMAADRWVAGIQWPREAPRPRSGPQGSQAHPTELIPIVFRAHWKAGRSRPVRYRACPAPRGKSHWPGPGRSNPLRRQRSRSVWRVASNHRWERGLQAVRNRPAFRRTKAPVLPAVRTLRGLRKTRGWALQAVRNHQGEPVVPGCPRTGPNWAWGCGHRAKPREPVAGLEPTRRLGQGGPSCPSVWSGLAWPWCFPRQAGVREGPIRHRPVRVAPGIQLVWRRQAVVSGNWSGRLGPEWCFHRSEVGAAIPGPVWPGRAVRWHLRSHPFPPGVVAPGLQRIFFLPKVANHRAQAEPGGRDHHPPGCGKPGPGRRDPSVCRWAPARPGPVASCRWWMDLPLQGPAGVAAGRRDWVPAEVVPPPFRSRWLMREPHPPWGRSIPGPVNLQSYPWPPRSHRAVSPRPRRWPPAPWAPCCPAIHRARHSFW